MIPRSAMPTRWQISYIVCMRQAAVYPEKTVKDEKVEARLPNAQTGLQVSPKMELIATRTAADRVRTLALGALADTFRDF